MFNGHICSNIVIFSYLNDIERTGGWGVYMSLSSGVWHRWMEKEILWFFSQGGAGGNDIRLDCFFEG